MFCYWMFEKIRQKELPLRPFLFLLCHLGFCFLLPRWKTWHLQVSHPTWKWESESSEVKVWKWKWESKSEKVWKSLGVSFSSTSLENLASSGIPSYLKVRKWKCKSQSVKVKVKVWKWKWESKSEKVKVRKCHLGFRFLLPSWQAWHLQVPHPTFMTIVIIWVATFWSDISGAPVPSLSWCINFNCILIGIEISF